MIGVNKAGKSPIGRPLPCCTTVCRAPLSVLNLAARRTKPANGSIRYFCRLVRGKLFRTIFKQISTRESSCSLVALLRIFFLRLTERVLASCFRKGKLSLTIWPIFDDILFNYVNSWVKIL
ncbi:hypothetical protein ACQ4LE_000202 [Meloidogyne hapla]